MTTVSSKFSHILPGVVVEVPDGQPENRIRTSPGISNPTSTTAWLFPGQHAVVLQPPTGWADPYPHDADGYAWVRVYAGKAIDDPKAAKKNVEVVGWTAAGKADGSEVYLKAADTTPLSK